ncbi:MAG: hypothetical protein U1C49_01035 [Candidatus Andersenbacteria bacterium]|nr:hypothetical protein [bacterium]MDZ4225411.1 hypothetical protein [Candidatus Andersenbacteria bacterium]
MLRAAKDTMRPGYRRYNLARRVASLLRVKPGDVTATLRQTACAVTGRVFAGRDTVISAVRLTEANPRSPLSYRLVLSKSLPELLSMDIGLVEEGCRTPSAGLRIFFRRLIDAHDKSEVNGRFGEDTNGNGSSRKQNGPTVRSRKRRDRRQKPCRRRLPLPARSRGIRQRA